MPNYHWVYVSGARFFTVNMLLWDNNSFTVGQVGLLSDVVRRVLCLPLFLIYESVVLPEHMNESAAESYGLFIALAHYRNPLFRDLTRCFCC